MQKKKRNGGFTLVELLVVIAVLAVLATVSIVGYTSFVEKAKVSVDVQTLEQLNLVLMANEQSGNGAQNVKDAYNQIYQAGLMPMYTPQGSNLGVCWDSQTNRFVLFQSGANANQGKIVHSTDSKVSNGVEVDVNNDNRFFVYNEPALCQHQWDEGQIVQQPTCTEQGLKTETCKICQTTQNKQVDATGHNWDNGTTTTPPTCQSNGTTTFCCTQCGATETETIAPTGHTEVVDNAVEATCTSTGLTEGKHCSVCNEVLVAQQVVDKKAHTEETIPAVEPTCTNTGLTTGSKCSVCGETLVAQQVVDALGHTEGSVVVENSIAPQCTVDGSYDNVIYCTVCNIELSRNTIIVDALGHTEVIDNAVEATCTNTGLTEGKHCSVCNEVLVAQQVVDKKAHTEETIPAVEPTCTNMGLTVGTKCSVCGETIVAQQVVGALGHTEVVDNAVEATCTSTGLTEGKHCSVCNEVLVVQQVVGLKPHTEETIPAVEPTCTNTGLTTGTKCSVCGETIVEQQVVGALGHTESSVVVENSIAPQCTVDGSYDNVTYCTVCNIELSRNTIIVDALGHTEVIDNAVEATCTNTGLTEGKHCSVCNEVLVAQQVVDKKAHTEETLSAVEPTCTNTGLTVGTKCSVCGETIVAQQVVGALGHTEVVDNAVEATCTSTGLTEGKHCSVCNEVLVAQQVVGLKPHTEETIPAVEPTCTNTGLTVGTKCSVCEEILVAQQVVETVDHNIVDGKCSYCGLQVATKTFSVYSADAVTVENGTYTTNYSAVNLQTETDFLLDTTLNNGTIAIKLGKDLTALDFSTYYWNGETNNSTIYLDLSGCTIAGAITLSASNVTLYVFDSSATKGKVGRINVGTSGQLFVWDVEISNSNNKSGITSNSVDVTMYSGSIHGCISLEHGGGINCINANVTIYDGKIYNNIAHTNGGGIYVSNGMIYLFGGEFYLNQATSDGGGICVLGSTNQDALIMENGHIYSNNANNGGGIHVKGNLVINGGTISGNSAVIGGGIRHHSGTITINNGTIGGPNTNGDAKIMANQATSQGAEIFSQNILEYNGGTLYLHNNSVPYSIYCSQFNNNGQNIVCTENVYNYIRWY